MLTKMTLLDVNRHIEKWQKYSDYPKNPKKDSERLKEILLYKSGLLSDETKRSIYESLGDAVTLEFAAGTNCSTEMERWYIKARKLNKILSAYELRIAYLRRTIESNRLYGGDSYDDYDTIDAQKAIPLYLARIELFRRQIK